MAVTPISLYARLLDLTGVGTTVYSSVVVDYQYQMVLDGPGTVQTMHVFSDTAFSNALDTAIGGNSGTGMPGAWLLSYSEDGGVSYDTHLVLEDAQRILTATGPGWLINQADAFQGYSLIGADRVTFVNQTVNTILNAPAGSLPAPFLAKTKGLFLTVPGPDRVPWPNGSKLAFTAVVDAALLPSSIVISVDVNADYLNNALTTILQQTGGIFIPGDTAPFGSRSHYIADPSDAALNVTGVDRGVAIGRVSNTPRLTFKVLQDTDVYDETTMARIIAEPQIEHKLTGMYAQVEAIGGSSNHGIASNASFTGIVVINPSSSTGSINWYDNLPIIGIKWGDYSGGVYYYPQHGYLVCMSPGQPMAVTSLCLNAAGTVIYAGTTLGVMTHSSTATDTSAWTQLGSLVAKVAQVWNDGTYVLAWVDGNSTDVDGVYCYPALSGEPSTTGYGGWSKIYSGSLAAAGGSVGQLFVADKNNPTVMTTIASGSQSTVNVPNGQQITRMTTYPGGVCFVFTAGGSVNGLYVVGAGPSLTNLNGDNSLVDAAGNPVQANNLSPYTNVNGVNRLTIGLLCATSAGPYFSPNGIGAGTLGGNWQPLGGSQNGLGNISLDYLVGGQTQTVLGTQLVRMFALNKSSLLYSNSGGDYWRDPLRRTRSTLRPPGWRWLSKPRVSPAAMWTTR